MPVLCFTCLPFWYVCFHYKMTNMDFHSDMTYHRWNSAIFFHWISHLMDGIDPQRLCSENSFWVSFSTGSTQATAPAAHPELSKGQDHLLRKKPAQLKNCTWEWLQKRGNNKPSFSWMPGAHMPGSGYYIVRFRSYQRWQCDFLLAWKVSFPCTTYPKDI